MYEEGTPEWHRIMAPYLENIAQFNANVERRNDDLEREMREYGEQLAEREEQAKEQLAQIQQAEAERKAAEELAKNPNSGNQWLRPRGQRNQYLSFGAQEDEPTQSFVNRQTRDAPTPRPRSAPPRVRQPPRTAAQHESRHESPASPFDRRRSPFEDYADDGSPSFIVDPTTEQAPPPPPPPKSTRRATSHRRDDYDDDDFSNNSWMR